MCLTHIIHALGNKRFILRQRPAKFIDQIKDNQTRMTTVPIYHSFQFLIHYGTNKRIMII